MKFLIVLACALAAASAGYITPIYTGPQHIPVIGPNGVPADTLEVQHARAEHLAASAEAYARSGVISTPVAPVPIKYVAPQHLPIIANGVPVDTPEVQLAKIAHFAAKAEAHARNGDYAFYAPLSHYYGVPSIAHDGTPLDTAEVAEAKLKHFAAHSEALARNNAIHYRKRRGIYTYAPLVYSGPQHIPAIGPNGVPLDTAEVQHAKAAHFAAKAEAHARNGDYTFAYAAPFTYNNAVPADTIEVQQAKLAHFAAKAEAHARNGDYAFTYATPYTYTIPTVLPVDTPEVQQAKAAHFAAKAEAYARHGNYAVFAPSYTQHVPVIANGVPLDTIEVQQAKAAHFAAHAKALSH